MRYDRCLMLVLLLGCSTPTPLPSIDTGDGEPDAQGGGDDEIPSAGDDGAASDGAPAGDTGVATPPRVRFVVLGDGGEGNAAQYQVGAAVKQICDARGCDFALYLGDNFYDNGVASVDDEQFQSKFEQPYAQLDFPFYVVLGNHDYGLLAVDQWRSDFQVAYTAVSTKWTMPARYYDFTAAHVHFFGLDTNAIMLDWTAAEQAGWLGAALAGSSSPWKIAFGHHPYVSNGAHGNAGNYEGCGVLCPVVNGSHIKSFAEASLCGSVDLYLCGHDHTRQWLQPVCGTELIVSGAAAKTTPLAHRDGQASLWEDDQSPGFMWVEIVADAFTGVFYDASGALQYQRTFSRQ